MASKLIDLDLVDFLEYNGYEKKEIQFMDGKKIGYQRPEGGRAFAEVSLYDVLLKDFIEKYQKVLILKG